MFAKQTVGSEPASGVLEEWWAQASVVWQGAAVLPEAPHTPARDRDPGEAVPAPSLLW